MHYKVFSVREFQEVLKFNGYYLSRSKGDHLIYVNSEGRHISIPATKVNPMVARRLIKENNLLLFDERKNIEEKEIYTDIDSERSL